MRAEIKKIYSIDVDNLKSFEPKDTESFSLNLRIIAGPEGEDGEESFDVEVCTPKWLLQTYGSNEVIIGRHHLIVFEYNYERLMLTIRAFCTSCVGETWKEVAEKLGRLGRWEFEDYKEYTNDVSNAS